MKVYVVVEYWMYDGAQVRGVYATEEKARQFVDLLEEEDGVSETHYYEVEDYEVVE